MTAKKQGAESRTPTTTPPSASAGADGLAKLAKQYGCGPVQLSGADNALYERHLLFDKVVDV